MVDANNTSGYSDKWLDIESKKSFNATELRITTPTTITEEERKEFSTPPGHQEEKLSAAVPASASGQSVPNFPSNRHQRTKSVKRNKPLVEPTSPKQTNFFTSMVSGFGELLTLG